MKLFRNCKNYMGRSRGKGIYAILAAMVLVTACAGRTKALGTDSPQEAVESVMQSANTRPAPQPQAPLR